MLVVFGDPFGKRTQANAPVRGVGPARSLPLGYAIVQLRSQYASGAERKDHGSRLEFHQAVNDAAAARRSGRSNAAPHVAIARPEGGVGPLGPAESGTSTRPASSESISNALSKKQEGHALERSLG